MYGMKSYIVQRLHTTCRQPIRPSRLWVIGLHVSTVWFRRSDLVVQIVQYMVDLICGLLLFLYSIVSLSISPSLSLPSSLPPLSLLTSDPLASMTFLDPITSTFAFIATQTNFTVLQGADNTLEIVLWEPWVPYGEVNINAKHPLVSSSANAFLFRSRTRWDERFELDSTHPTEMVQMTPHIGILLVFRSASELVLIMAATSEGTNLVVGDGVSDCMMSWRSIHRYQWVGQKRMHCIRKQLGFCSWDIVLQFSQTLSFSSHTYSTLTH